MVGDSALPTVSLAVVLRISLLRGKLQPSSQCPQGSLAGAYILRNSRVLTMAANGLNPALEAAVSLSPIPTSVS